MSDVDTNATVAFAREVQRVVAAAGIPSALIGATAMAAHFYVRATIDIDFAVVCDLASLRTAATTIRDHFTVDVELSEPDADDHLGGVLTVRKPGCLPIQFVNFVNEKRARNHNPGAEAIRTRLVDPSFIDVVDLPHLIALKVWAGGPKSSHDVLSLLEVNPDRDLAAIDDVCARFDLTPAWQKLRPATGP